MTAKEFLQSKEPNTYVVPEEWLIEFAEFHVQNALEAASDIDLVTEENYTGGISGQPLYTFDKRVDVDSILNCYPLENIK